MLFTIHALDRADAGSLRAETRPEHLQFLRGLGAAVIHAGPLLDPGGAPVGTLLLLEAEDQAAAEAILAGDPYRRVGLFAETRIHGHRRVLPE